VVMAFRSVYVGAVRFGFSSNGRFIMRSLIILYVVDHSRERYLGGGLAFSAAPFVPVWPNPEPEGWGLDWVIKGLG
jgi:hypothetical protein